MESAPVPGAAEEMRLYRRGSDYSIRIAGRGELMSSRVHGSEIALAERTCAKLSAAPNPRLLIGGLGMGFTLAAALNVLGPRAQVVVCELVPAVLSWNRGVLGELTGHPLADPRVSVREGDVARILRSEERAYDAILLDVDNGPDGLTRKQNDWLYELTGLSAAYTALKLGGVLAVWSAGPDRKFSQRLRKLGFDVDEERVRAHGSKGARHLIWLARRVA